MVARKFFTSLIVLFSLLNARGSLLLVGGGGEDYNSWSDIPYSWFVEKTDSGKIVNIDTDEANSWYANYFKSMGASSESHALQITSAIANDSSTYQDLISAQGIFIEGGDQWEYVNSWKGTLVEDAIHHVFNNGGAIGGTSAGLAIMGEICFDARNGSASPEETAQNAWDPNISLTDDFLEVLPEVLTDSHFHPSGRLGRLVPMMAQRILFHDDQNLMGIGIDDKTALCIESNYKTKTFGKGSVTILYPSENSEITSEQNQPVKFTNIIFHQLVHGMEYDLHTREPIDPEKYLDPVNYSPQTKNYQSVTINGSDSEAINLGEVKVEGLTTNYLNAWYGDLSISNGDNNIPGAVIIPRIWSNSDFFENRIVGGLFAAASNPGFQSIFLDSNCTATVNEDGILNINDYAIVLDTKAMEYVGFPQQQQEDAPIPESNHPGIIGATLHFLSNGDTYNLQKHDTEIDNSKIKKAEKFQLYNIFPNPFNPKTKIKYHLPQKAFVNLEIFNLQGTKITTLIDEQQTPNHYTFSWSGRNNNGEQLSSGVYFIRLAATHNGQTYSQSQKILLVR